MEFSGGLFAPFRPSAATLGESVCLPHKQTVLSVLPMGGESSLEELEEQQLHYPRSSCSNNSWQRSQRISLAAHDAHHDDDDDDDDDEAGDIENDEEEEDEDDEEYVAAGSERRLEEAIAPAVAMAATSTTTAEQCNKMAANDANCLENGRKLIQVSKA